MLRLELSEDDLRQLTEDIAQEVTEDFHVLVQGCRYIECAPNADVSRIAQSVRAVFERKFKKTEEERSTPVTG